MIEIQIESFEHYHSEVTTYAPGALFRGVNDSKYELIPSIGRYLPQLLSHGHKEDYLYHQEKYCLEIFEKDVIQLENYKNRLDICQIYYKIRYYTEKL